MFSNTSLVNTSEAVWQVMRGGEDVWMPPGGASISTAAAAEGVVVASCTHFKVKLLVKENVCAVKRS